MALDDGKLDTMPSDAAVALLGIDDTGKPVLETKFAAISTESEDNTQSINYALEGGENSEVVIPPGTWRVDGMVEVAARRTLVLSSGATLVKPSATADNETDPIVWLKGSNAAVLGRGKAGLTSEVRSPNGVLRFGHPSFTESTYNISFSKLCGMQLTGMQAYGQTTGLPDKGLYMPSPQLGGFVNYFHRISEINVSNVNVGVHLEGWANGLLIDSVYGSDIGNQTLDGDSNCAFFLSEGALDNIITGLSLHRSSDTPTIVVTNIDNRGSGGNFYESLDNTFIIMNEQGGASARPLVARGGRASYYDIRGSVGGAPDLFADFYRSNTLMLRDGPASAWRIGKAHQREYNGTGTQTIRVAFAQDLDGSANYNGVVELLFSGVTPTNANRQVAKYLIPINSSSASALAIGTPVKIAGDDLTITQTASAASGVTFDVAGSSTSQNVSILVTGTANRGLAFL